MDKYNRNYLLKIEKKDGTMLIVGRPFTVEFEVFRNSTNRANAASIRIYNLSENNRSQIRKDQWEFGELRKFEFFAGYGEKLSLAFKGDISQAFSVREGTNMITQMESFDSGYDYINAVTDEQFPKDTPQSSILDALISTMTVTTKGAIGDFSGKISRGNSYSGSTTDILAQITGGAFFIDNGKANCLTDSECIEGDITLINEQSGLLGTPILEQMFLNFDILFEPNLRVGQLVRLQSSTARYFNGDHKVISIRHRGMISEAVCGNAVTSVGLLPGVFTPIPQES